jgi:hypothetical protein
METPTDSPQKLSTNSSIAELWSTHDQYLWERALARYWSYVKPANLQLEREMEHIDSGAIRSLGPQEWYRFLIDEYARWKYTDPRRLSMTRKRLSTYKEDRNLEALNEIKERLFAFDRANARLGLKIAGEIYGFGTAGASGLLAVMFPADFGTVDRFVVEALRQIPELPEAPLLARMNPSQLTERNGEVLITIMHRKAKELNLAFSTEAWTPRKVDMILWSYAR